jgi:hypothetical protein
MGPAGWQSQPKELEPDYLHIKESQQLSISWCDNCRVYDLLSRQALESQKWKAIENY